MSLVNEMLNDLDDRRKKQPAEAVDVSWLATGPSANAPEKKVQLWLLPAIVVVAAFIFVFWQYVRNDLAVVAQETSVEKAEVITAEKPIITPVPEQPKVVASEKQPVVVVQPVVTAQTEQPVKPESEKPEPEKQEQVTNKAAVVQAAPDVEKTVAKATTVSKPAAKVTTSAVKKPLPLTPAQQDQRVFLSAQSLIRKAKYAEAEAELNALLDREPRAIKSAELLASLLLSLQRYAAVDSLYQRLASQKIGSYDLQAIVARSYLMAGRAAQAVSLLSASEPSLADHPAYYEILALAAQRDRQYALSAQTYQRLLRTNANRGDWWMGLAIGLDQQQQYASASNAYRRALQLAGLSDTLRAYAEQRLTALAGKHST